MHALQQRSLVSTCIEQKQSDRLCRYEILTLARQYDLVIIDAEINGPAQQPGMSGGTEPLQDELLIAGEDNQRKTPCVNQIIRQMDMLVRRTPVWACVLIGGKSSRMGQPKHLIEDNRKTTWLEREVKILAPLVDKIMVSGAGRLPDNLSDISRLDDIPGVAGPLTGIVAAIRSQPMVSWLLAACDMPHFSTEAIKWLLDQRRAGCWGLVPQLAGSTRVEPLLAWYDFRAGHIFEEQLARKNLRISNVATHPKIDNPVIPLHLRQSWQNINTPNQLSAALEQIRQSE